MQRFEELLGQKIAVGKREELLSAAAELLGKGGAIATVNPVMLVDALRNRELFSALSESLCIPDGVGVASALRKRGVHTEVFPGVELCEALLDFRLPAEFGDRGVGFALIGGREGVAEGARDYLLAKHGGAKCLYLKDGYSFSEEELCRALCEKSPDIAMICLGSPKQELLISRLRGRCEHTLFIGLGGSLDVFSGRVKRAPPAFRRLRLEWLFRMIKEPRRLAKIPTLIDFLWLVRLQGRRDTR